MPGKQGTEIEETQPFGLDRPSIAKHKLPVYYYSCRSKLVNSPHKIVGGRLLGLGNRPTFERLENQPPVWLSGYSMVVEAAKTSEYSVSVEC